MKKILIAHQSTIPHYRVDFYNALEAARPDSWCFDVVFDSSELQKKKFFKEQLDIKHFNFPTLETKTYAFKIGEKVFNFQSFFFKAVHYDLIVVGSTLSNITYPLCVFLKLAGLTYVIWGHGKDRSIAKPSRFKKLLEVYRSILSRSASGFMAYTPSVKNYLELVGVNPEKIYILNNTIDILKQRQFYEKYRPDRQSFKEMRGLGEKKVLLFVGRFTKNKRLDFLVEAFAELLKIDTSFHLIMVGGDSFPHHPQVNPNITFCGSLTDLKTLAPIYVASDALLFPGDVGLGPLQALCYDLPVITIDAPTHMPEIDYLNQNNSVILPFATTPKEYAEAVYELFNTQGRLLDLRSSTWLSIKQLTIERMAQNFINGINHILLTS